MDRPNSALFTRATYEQALAIASRRFGTTTNVRRCGAAGFAAVELGVWFIASERGKIVGQASAVRASGPTARPAHASLHLINADLDAPLPGGFLLGRSDPTDPLVSGQRGNIGPEALGSDVRFDGLSEVGWQFMNRAVSDFLSRHASRVFVPPSAARHPSPPGKQVERRNDDRTPPEHRAESAGGGQVKTPC